MTEYLKIIRSSERNIEAVTDDAFGKHALGVRAPRIASLLSEALDSLAQLASCASGCRGKDHTVENLLRRLVNLALGARKLAWAGYYDEALLLVRSGAEVANLLQLFSLKPERERVWRATADSREFTPLNVRLSIEAAGASPFIDKDRYGALCKVAAHATHDFALASHDLSDRQDKHVGPWFAVPGLLLVLSEILAIIQPCLQIAGTLTEQSPERQRALESLADDMNRYRAPITVENYRVALAAVRLSRNNASAE